MTKNSPKQLETSKKDNILKALSHYNTEDLELVHKYLAKKQQFLIELMLEGIHTNTSYKQNKMLEEAHERSMLEWAENGIII